MVEQQEINDFLELVKDTPNSSMIAGLTRKVVERAQQKPDPKKEEFIKKRDEVYARLANSEDFQFFMNKEILPYCLPTDDETDKFELGEQEKAHYAIAKFCRRILFRAIKTARRYNNAR